MADRQIDWRGFVDRLIYCYGCGRFGIPRKGVRPRGWSMLYQPHAEGPSGLNVCSEGCADDVRLAMTKGPLTEPLKMASGITMDVDMKKAMMDEAMQHAIDGGRMDDMFMVALQREGDEDV